MARILIADDSKVIRELLKHYLGAMGHSILVAEDGVVGFNCFVEERANIDFIVSDLNMPRLDGIAMIRKIKEHCESVPGRSLPPIMALTAQTDPKLKEEGKSIGVVAWMNKPIDESAFKGVVNLILEKYK